MNTRDDFLASAAGAASSGDRWCAGWSYPRAGAGDVARPRHQPMRGASGVAGWSLPSRAASPQHPGGVSRTEGGRHETGQSEPEYVTFGRRQQRVLQLVTTRGEPCCEVGRAGGRPAPIPIRPFQGEVPTAGGPGLVSRATLSDPGRLSSGRGRESVSQPNRRPQSRPAAGRCEPADSLTRKRRNWSRCPARPARDTPE